MFSAKVTTTEPIKKEVAQDVDGERKLVTIDCVRVYFNILKDGKVVQNNVSVEGTPQEVGQLIQNMLQENEAHLMAIHEEIKIGDEFSKTGKVVKEEEVPDQNTEK